MFTTSIRNVLIGLVLSFTIGTSALVVTNFERDPVVHRRHAHANANANANDGAAVLDLIARAPVPAPVPVPVSGPVSPRMSMSLARRRELRQKRCIAHLQGADSSSSSSSSSIPVAPTDAPVNAAPAPNNDQPTSSSQAEQPAPSSNSGGGSGTFTGELTYYDTGLGACGRTNTDSDMIAAASMLLFDGFEGYPIGANPNNNPICGRRVNIYFEGKSITVELTDRCVGCAKYDLDLSPTAFQMLADMGRGRVSGATWSWA